ncbi:MAG: tripartite tricarboxylate transporter substrate-binding protein [Pseudomonadota bacterium]
MMESAHRQRRLWLKAGWASSMAGALPLGVHGAAPEIPASARIVLGFPAGSAADMACRLFAQALQGRYARAVIVDNKAGAAGRIGVADLMGTPANGGTLLLTPTSVLTLYPHIYKNLAYDPFADLLPVTRAATTTFALCVGPLVPASVKTLAQYLDWCRANPGSASFGSPGAGSSPHFLGAMLARYSGVPLLHVPYKGTAVAINDLLAQQVSSVVVSPGNVKQYIPAKGVRILAVTSPTRWDLLPAVPTMTELGFPQATNTEPYAFFMRKGTRPELVERATAALRAAASEPTLAQRLADYDMKVETSTPAELTALLRRDHARWQEVVRTVGFSPMD